MVFAQLLSQVSLDNFIELETIPQFPKANENIFFEVISYSTDLNQATIIWLKNGKQVVSGVGLKNFSTKAGRLGEKIKVSAFIKTSDNKEVVKTATVIASEVDLIWEANSYTPPFYKGKALFPNEGDITVVAFPHILNDGGQRINDNRIIYKWMIGDKVLVENSGVGKKTYTYTSDILLDPFDITVEASAPDMSRTAKNSIFVESINPIALFYKNDPIFGILSEKNIEGVLKISDPEIVLTVIPYFFSVKRRDNGLLNYEWNMNNKILEKMNKSTMTFRNEGSKEGMVKLSTQVSHFTKQFQNIANGFTIQLNSGQSAFTENSF